MRLTAALRLDQPANLAADQAVALRLDQPAPTPPRLAFVGAGGKTTAIFHLARELPGPVLVTATSHLALEQLALADRHIFESDLPPDLADLATAAPPQVILVTGPAGDDQRTAGISAVTLARLRVFADQAGWPMLIEADGSRRLPLKAPAAHEPPIPAFVDRVVVVAGLSGLGQPLDEDHIHRPELFAALSGLSRGAAVDPAALARVLVHPQGGMKNVPPQAQAILLLNQANAPERQAAAQRIAQLALPTFSAVICADLPLARPASAVQTSRDADIPEPTPQPEQPLIFPESQPSPQPTSRPLTYRPLSHRPPTPQPVSALFEPHAAVILAAGAATRFGQSKQLLDWHGRPLVRQVAETALQAGLGPVVVVLGAYAAEIRQALAGLPLVLVDNPDFAAGQSTSLRAGLLALPAAAAGALFLLADQPQIPAALLRALVAAHSASRASIVAPLIDGQRGNPVLFDRGTFPALATLQGDRGGRALFARYPVEWLPWHDARLLWDIDTPADYQRLLEAGL